MTVGITGRAKSMVTIRATAARLAENTLLKLAGIVEDASADTQTRVNAAEILLRVAMQNPPKANYTNP